MAGGFLLQVLPNAKEEEIARFEKRIQEMPAISTLLESEDHIEALLSAIYGMNLSNASLKKNFASSATAAMSAF